MKKAAQLGVILIFPDTSPRDVDIIGDRDDPFFGISASWYCDPTQGEWAKHYKLYTHITEELRDIVEKKFNVDPEKQSICGHSMGGHGALVMYFRNPKKYVSCSALAPVVNFSQTEWGKKALTEFFGDDKEEWKKYDA